MASVNAFCKPSARLAPRTVLSKNKASALPSMRLCRPGTALASAPKDCSFFSKAGVAFPLASKPTATGISFWETALSAACAATATMWTPRRRGDA